MAILSKPGRSTVVLNADDSKKFIKEFNSKKPSDEFTKSCKKARELFTCGQTKKR
ncbi:MAG: hypothetical protein RR614_00870 [Eubacterium sp.]